METDISLMEAAPLLESLSAEERASIRARVSVLETGLLVIRSAPIQTAASFRVMYERIHELVDGWESFVQVVDLREAKPIDAEARAELKSQVAELAPRIKFVAVVARRNVAVRAMVRLVGYALSIHAMSLYDSMDSALEAAHHALR